MIDTVAARRSLRTETTRPSAQGTEVSHILIPVTLSASDVAALRLGLQMAASTGARVTVLQVGFMPIEPPSRNWLDSIDRLHLSLDGSAAMDGQTLARAAADRLRAFVDSACDGSLPTEVEAALVTRPGDFSEEVLRYARTQPTELVILPGDALQGWLPGARSRLHRKLQQMGKRVLAVWPEAATSRLLFDLREPSLAS
jgi:hypothetical protein